MCEYECDRNAYRTRLNHVTDILSLALSYKVDSSVSLTLFRFGGSFRQGTVGRRDSSLLTQTEESRGVSIVVRRTVTTTPAPLPITKKDEGLGEDPFIIFYNNCSHTSRTLYPLLHFGQHLLRIFYYSTINSLFFIIKPCLGVLEYTGLLMTKEVSPWKPFYLSIRFWRR